MHGLPKKKKLNAHSDNEWAFFHVIRRSLIGGKGGVTMKKMVAIVIFLQLFFVVGNVFADQFPSDCPISLLGYASWYSETDPGILPTTANMETFDDSQLTCAAWGVPFNTIIEVTNNDTGQSIRVRVNDRGPAHRLVKEGRVIDLTKAAFARIADLRRGLVSVRITMYPPAI